ncbi:MAG: hypothetical protein ACI3V3_07685 [Faecousia sp.]
MNIEKKALHLLGRILDLLEVFLAVVILLVLVALVGLEIYNLVGDPAAFLADGFLDGFLGRITTLVVALEFVKMLLHPTVGNTLELLIMAISRYVVVNHHDHISILVGILSIVALFATRRFLISRKAAESMDAAAERVGTED